MKVLVIGSGGQLGLVFQKISNSYDSLYWVFSTIKTLDLLKLDTISSFLNDINPSVIINCAAYTSVDKAETESKLADIINYKAVDIISRWLSGDELERTPQNETEATYYKYIGDDEILKMMNSWQYD